MKLIILIAGERFILKYKILTIKDCTNQHTHYVKK